MESLRSNIGRGRELECFTHPAVARDSWRRWQEGYLASCVWVGAISFGCLAANRWIKVRYSLSGMVGAVVLYALSERADGFAIEGDLRVNALETFGDPEALGNEVRGLQGRVDLLRGGGGRSPVRRLWDQFAALFRSASPVAPELIRSVADRDETWETFCHDLHQRLGRMQTFHPEQGAEFHYFGALLRSMQRVVETAEWVAAAPESDEAWDAFLQRKLDLAYLLSFLYNVEVPLEGEHPRVGERVAWRTIDTDLKFGRADVAGERRAGLLSLYRSSFEQLFVGRRPE